MKLPTTRLLTTALTFTLALPLFAAELGTSNSLIAHEWGTFTSVAGPDGDPVRWAVLAGPADLPCFVARGPQYKGELAGLVRMETPVLYFYSPKQMKLSVNVQFPLGNITEWYPKASRTERSGLTWDSVELTPNESPAFPTTKGESRYFAARNTDATPLNIAGQREKMIFYRGVGGFAIPLRPKFIGGGDLGTSGSGVEIRNIGNDPISLAILLKIAADSSGIASNRTCWKQRPSVL